MTQTPQKRWQDEHDGADPDVRAARSLLDRFEDEPKAGARARVWARLALPSERRPFGSWSLVFGGAAAVACGLAIAFAATKNGGLESGTSSVSATAELEAATSAGAFFQIAGVEGEVLATPTKDAPDQNAQRGAQLSSGGRLRTGAKGRASLRLASIGTLSLDPFTEVSAKELATGVSVDLAQGSLFAAVEPLAPNTSFELTSGPWKVLVIGARFHVERISKEHISVSVERGSVHVLGPDGEREIEEAGRFVSNAVAAVEPTPPAEDPAVGKTETPRHVRVLRRAKAQKERREKDNRDGSKRPGAAVAPIAPIAPMAPVAPIARVAPVDPVAPTVHTTVAKTADSVDAKAEVPANAPAMRSQREIYEQATGEKDPTQALALYDLAAELPGPLAEIAAHQAARLSMRLQNFREAERRFEKLLANHSLGTFDQEARLNLLECRIRVGQIKTARADLNRFLMMYPNSERQPELRFLRAEILRRSGECREAIGDYQAADAGRHADDALYFQAWCQLETGQVEPGKKTLSGYLVRFPAGKHRADAEKGLRNAQR